MADNLCGPSNALQNFQKHTSVDRTLQQDRLTSRQSPTQGFRSAPGPNAGILDPEFDAFQAGHAGPPQPGLHFQPPPVVPPRFAPAPQGPDWASDFQRLNLNTPQPPPLQQHRPLQPSNAAASWHQDFLRQQAPAPQAPMQQQTMFGGIPRQTMGWTGPAFQNHVQGGFGAMNTAPLSDTAQGKQRAQEDVPQFDDAAFERAFEQAQQDALQEAQEMMEGKAEQEISAPIWGEGLTEEAKHKEMLNIIENNMEILEETRSVPVKDKFISILPAARLRMHLQNGELEEAEKNINILEEQQKSGVLWSMSNGDALMTELWSTALNLAPPTWKERARIQRLLHETMEYRMSSKPLFGPTLHSPADSDHLAQQQEQKPEDQQTLQNRDDEELASTAGALLEKVADNTSEKFQNSHFLALMRRLRDREVRVEGDRMVEVSGAQSSTSPPPSTMPAGSSAGTGMAAPHTATEIPPIDPNILSHAAQDFEMPIDSEYEIMNAVYE